MLVRSFERVGDLLRDRQRRSSGIAPRAMRWARSLPSTSSITSAHRLQHADLWNADVTVVREQQAIEVVLLDDLRIDDRNVSYTPDRRAS